MFGIGMTELLVILVIGLLVLGPKKLPELARSLGKGLSEFRRASTDMRREFLDVADETRDAATGAPEDQSADEPRDAGAPEAGAPEAGEQGAPTEAGARTTGPTGG